MILRKFALLVAALVLSFPLAGAAQTPAREARFAFVIGSDAYQAPLRTAANDAALIADTLQAAGFAVTGARNLDQDTFRASYREFLEKVAAAGPDAVAAIYLSGYGFQFEGENYFLPANAQIARDADIPIGAIRVSDLTRPLSGLSAKTRFVMLDVAYENPPIARSIQIAPGLMLVDAEPGSLIAFNAAPGTLAPVATGDYGPYAQALAEAMHEPGLSLDEIFARTRLRVSELTKGRVTPWADSKLTAPFVLFEQANGAPAPRVSQLQIEEINAKPIHEFGVEDAYAAALRRDTIEAYADFLAAFPSSPFTREVRGLLAARREALTWRRTAAVNTREAYWSYLRRYPKGPHGVDARRRLARLSAQAQPPADFVAIGYDVPPPPPDEVVFFDEPEVVYYDQSFAPPPPRAVFLPPPPPWWSPPPVVVEDDEDYYLWTPRRETRPDWMRAPRFVQPPAPPVYEGGGQRPSIAPYVAIPAALAAGIVAGRIINRRAGNRPAVGAPPQGGQPQRRVLAPVSAPANAAVAPRNGPPANQVAPLPGRQPGQVLPPAVRVPPNQQNVQSPQNQQQLLSPQDRARAQQEQQRLQQERARQDQLQRREQLQQQERARQDQVRQQQQQQQERARQQQDQQRQERARQDQQRQDQLRQQQDRARQQQDQQRLQQQDRARQDQQRQDQLRQQQDRARQQQDQQRQQQQDRARQDQQRQQQQQQQQERARQQQDQQRVQQQQQERARQDQQRQQQQQQQERARQQQDQQRAQQQQQERARQQQEQQQRLQQQQQQQRQQQEQQQRARQQQQRQPNCGNPGQRPC